jgi:hypothetical protein
MEDVTVDAQAHVAAARRAFVGGEVEKVESGRGPGRERRRGERQRDAQRRTES